MITHKKLATWHQCLAKIISYESGSKAIAELLKGLESLVNGNSSMAIIYPANRRPIVTHHRLLANEVLDIQIDGYINGAYLLDPYYLKAVKETTEDMYVIDDVAPDAFEQSEYYNVYYKQSNLSDEACFLFKREDNTILSISIGRAATMASAKFSADEISLLRTATPLVKQIVLNSQTQDKNQDTDSLEQHLDNALETFGSSILTPRESQVLQLLLKGHSIKSIAQNFENSLETIKSHRKNIYSKLDVNSQAELFHLFIDALRNATNCNEDPLISYSSTQ